MPSTDNKNCENEQSTKLKWITEIHKIFVGLHVLEHDQFRQVTKTILQLRK